MRYILYAILIYLAYQLVFKLIIPVYIASRKIKKQFREMSARMNGSDGHSRMEEQRSRQEGFSDQPKQSPAPVSKVNPEDYIEFEEVR